MREISRIKINWAACVLALPLLSASCVTPAPPPTYSFAKYARPTRPSTPQKGRVSANLAYARVSTDDSDDVLSVFPWSEASLGLALGEFYDLSVSAHAAKLNVDGQLTFPIGDVARIGLIHGGGLGMVEGDELVVFVDVTGGLMAQVWTTDSAYFFGGAKVVYSTYAGGGGDVSPMIYGGGAIGAGFALTKSLLLSPELMIAKGVFTDVDGSLLFVIPSVSLAATF